MGLFSRDSGDDADTGETGSPWEGRGFVAAAIVVGALGVCGLVWFFAGDGDEPSSTPPPPVVETTAVPTEQPTDGPTPTAATPIDEPTRTPSAPPPANNSTGGCNAKTVDLRRPKVAPPAVSWVFEADMMIPLQKQGGPARQDQNGLRYCYAHSPTGAVMAAMGTLGQIRNPDLTEAVLRRRVVPGPGRNIAMKQAKTSATPDSGTTRTAQFTGFKILDYQPDRAIVSVAVRVDARSVASLPVTMAWHDGDWKMALQPDGTINGETEPDLLGSLDGYVRFGGA